MSNSQEQTTAQFQVAWMKKHLIGARLTEVYLDEDSEDPSDEMSQFPVLVFQRRNRPPIFAVLQADSEGNGTGWLHLVDQEGKFLDMR